MSQVTGNSSAGTAKRLLYTNIVTLVVIICVLCVGPYVSSTLSVVASVKLVVELLCSYLLASNLVLTTLLTDVELPPHKSRRSTSLKVIRAKCSVQFCSVSY